MTVTNAVPDGPGDLPAKLDELLALMRELADRPHGCTCNHTAYWQWTPQPMTTTTFTGDVTYWPNP